MLEDRLVDPDWTKATGSRGTPVKGRPTKRQAAKAEAERYGIDPKGMSTREINAAVKYAQDQTKMVAEEMSKFINTTGQQFSATKKSEDLNSTRTPATTTNRITEDKPSKFVVSGTPPAKPATSESGGGGGSFTFPPDGWTTLTVALCKDNAPAEAVILAQDPLYEPP